MLKLSGFRGTLHQPDENVIERREYLVEGADVQPLVDEILDYIIVGKSFVDLNFKLV